MSCLSLADIIGIVYRLTRKDRTRLIFFTSLARLSTFSCQQREDRVLSMGVTSDIWQW